MLSDSTMPHVSSVQGRGCKCVFLACRSDEALAATEEIAMRRRWLQRDPRCLFLFLLFLYYLLVQTPALATATVASEFFFFCITIRHMPIPTDISHFEYTYLKRFINVFFGLSWALYNMWVKQVIALQNIYTMNQDLTQGDLFFFLYIPF